jgi:hypothetical protein
MLGPARPVIQGAHECPMPFDRERQREIQRFVAALCFIALPLLIVVALLCRPHR